MVLDEAHTIKSSKSQISIAAAALVAGRRWCLTGTPIQVKFFFRDLCKGNLVVLKVLPFLEKQTHSNRIILCMS